MSRAVRVRTPASKFAEVDRDIYELYRRLRGEGKEIKWRETVTFSAPGAFALNVEGVGTPDNGKLLARVDLMLVTAGSDTTTVTIYQNGVSVGTASLAGSDAGPTPTCFAIGFSPQVDRIGAKVTTKGTGSVGLTIHCRFL